MKRVVVIEEEGGVYRVRRADGRVGQSLGLERALEKSVHQDDGPPGLWLFHTAEVLEDLLGPKRESGGQIHEGVVSA